MSGSRLGVRCLAAITAGNTVSPLPVHGVELSKKKLDSVFDDGWEVISTADKDFYLYPWIDEVVHPPPCDRSSCICGSPSETISLKA